MEQIRFFFDPRCPWCYQTARLAWRLEALGEVGIDWAFFSLEVVNRPEGSDFYPGSNLFKKEGARIR